MPALLTQASTLMCPHGGTVIAIPSSIRVAAAGAPVLRASDTFVIVGCPFPTPATPHPCVTVQWVVTAQRVKHSADFVLNEASVGLCLAGDLAPQGVVLIAATQPRVSGL
jgi:hypothetical protein